LTHGFERRSFAIRSYLFLRIENKNKMSAVIWCERDSAGAGIADLFISKVYVLRLGMVLSGWYVIDYKGSFLVGMGAKKTTGKHK
jgi:hypothetical protein